MPTSLLAVVLAAIPQEPLPLLPKLLAADAAVHQAAAAGLEAIGQPALKPLRDLRDETKEPELARASTRCSAASNSRIQAAC